MAFNYDQVLNVFQDHKFSVTHDHAISIYYKLSNLIVDKTVNPKDIGKHKMRNQYDKLFTDRRMQGLLRYLTQKVDEMSGKQKVIVLWSTVKLKYVLLVLTWLECQPTTCFQY